MDEEFVIYLWRHKLINFDQIGINDTNEKIQILSVGTKNSDSGPDFFNARIKIDKTIWAGNIEVHVKSSDWKKHHHEADTSYDNIILHVVYIDDTPVHRINGERIPTIQLKGNFDNSILAKYQAFIANTNWIPCEHQIKLIDNFTRFAWLESLCIERLEEKAQSIGKQLDLSQQNFTEIFYRHLCRNFGFKTNADAFELLARSLTFQILSKHINRLDQLEALLFGQAGMLEMDFFDDYPIKLKNEYEFLSEKYKLVTLDSKIWKFLRMRPSNFPTIRISQFANLLYAYSGLLMNALQLKRLDDIRDLMKVDANEYWRNHSNFDRLSKSKSTLLGSASIDLILINTIIPFTFIYGRIFKMKEAEEKALLWYEQIKPEKNSISIKFSNLGLNINNAKQSQAVIQLKTNYCEHKRCLSCRFGHALISKGV